MNTDFPNSRIRRVAPIATAFLLSTNLLFVDSRADAANLLWRGQSLVNSNWDNSTSTNWFNTVALTNAPFTPGANVTFDDTGIANPIIITNAVEPGTVTISANTINYVFAGAGSITNLSNPTAGTNVVGLTKSNNGTLTIQTTNTYTGPTILNGGIVSVGQMANGGIASAIGAASAVSANLIFNGGQLQYTGPNAAFNRGTTLDANGGTISVATSSTILTNSGVFTGVGGLTVTGSGALGLSGANTYSGGTIINAGATAKLLNGTAFGAGNIANNGTLLFGSSSTVGNNINGAGILTNAPGVTTILGGSNSFTGNVYNGTFGSTASILVISNSDALDGTSLVTLSGGSSSTLQLAVNSAAVGAVVNVPSSVTLVMITGNSSANRAALSTVGGAGNWNGPITLKGDGTGNELDSFVTGSSSPFTINGNITAASSDKFSGQVDFYGGAGDLAILNGNFLFNTNADFYGPNNATCTWLINSSGNTCGLVYVVAGTIKLGVDNAMPANIPYVLGSANNPGILDLAGHNQQVGGLTNNASGTGAGIITNSSPTVATLTYTGLPGYYTTFQFSGFFTNFSGIIGGKVGLTVAGGILNLSGANAYYGATSISNGAILALTGNGSIAKSANLIVWPNATFSQASGVGSANNPFALGAAQTLTGVGASGNLAGNIYMQAGSSLVLNYDGSTPTLVVTNGTFTCTNSGVVTVNVPNSLSIGSSFSYLLVSNGLNGTVAGTVPSSVVVNGISDVAGSLAINGAGLVLTVTNYTPKNLEWRGTVSTNWDGVTTNWYDKDASALDFTNFATLDNVTFDDNVGVSNNMVNISEMVQPGMVTVSANNTNYTFNGTGGIVGGGGLIMSGNSTLTILTTNSYTGVTAISGGVVSVNNLALGGAASAIGAAGGDPANLVLNGGQLQYTGPSVSIDRGATLNGSGATLAVTTPGSTLATSGTIAGSGGLTVSGSGIVALGGANTYSGGTTVNGGTTLQLVGGGSFGTGNVTNDSILLFSGANIVINNITGPGILTNAPGGTLTLSGTNTDTGNIYSGGTNMTPSTVIVANSAALAPNTTVTIAGGNSSVLAVGAGVSTPTNVTLVGISGNNNLNRVTLNILGAAGAWNGPMILEGDGMASGSFAQIAAPAGVIGSVNGNTMSITNGPLTFNGQIDIRGANSQGILNGRFTLGPGVLWAPNDAASWILNSTSNTWGISDIANGKITLGADNALPVTVPVEGGGGNGTFGILDLNGHNQEIGGLTSIATGTGNMIVTNSSVVYATLTYSNPANFYQAIGFTNYLGTDYATPFYKGTYTNFTGLIEGNMGLTVAAGTLNLGGVNTYTGVTTINGVLSLTSSGSIGMSTNIIIGGSATFAPSGQSLSSGQTLTGAGGTGTIAGNLNLSAGSSVVFDNYTPNVPTLTVSNATLTFLGGNTATVNVSGSPTLSQASYLLVSATGTGLISGTPPTSVIVNGIANPPGTYGAYLSIQGGQLYLTISQSPVILSQFPITYTNLFTLYKGANPIFTIPGVSGAPPFTYQWYTNNVLDGAATAAHLSLTNVQSSFANDYCIVGNTYGSATSFVWSASVIADPTNSNGALANYPSNVLALDPIAYWRMNETDDGLSDGNPGALTHDYAGGNDALYTNADLGRPCYNPHRDPSDTSTLFGIYSGNNSYAGQIGENIDFGTPTGSNAEFSVETWVALNQNTGGGIVAKGWGGGGEEFAIDTGAAGNAFRFFVRSAAGVSYAANSTIVPQMNSNAGNPQDNVWYHLAGVCDETNGNVLLYVNGVLAASNSIPALSGIASDSSVSMTIGARSNNQTNGIANPPNLTLQTVGSINDVAVFNYALSANQIAAEYQAAQPFAPVLTSQLPVTYTNFFTLFAGANPSFTVTAAGTTPFSYQWFTNGALDGAATTNILQMTGVQAGVFSNYCIVTNIGGAVTSTVWAASVITDPTAPYPTAVLAGDPIGYWRMNEPDDGSVGADGEDGIVCHDYMGGNDGIYTNVYTGLYQGYSTSDPATTSTLFGFVGSFIDNYAGLIEGVDFAAPTGTTTNFTVEVWENGYAGEQLSASTIVSKGVCNLNDQFALDYDTTASHNLRFYVRAANGTLYICTNTMTADNNWHHLAGVCDEADGVLKFYVDGTLVTSTAIPKTAGLFEPNYPMAIGAEQNLSETVSYTLQYSGFVNDVAAYNYALTAGQIANQFDASGNGSIAPYFAPAPPVNAAANAGSTLTVQAAAIGTPPISYMWTNVTIGAAITSGSTNTSAALNATLNYANVPANWNGNQLELMVSNASGTTNAFVTLAISNISPNPTNIVFSVTNNFLYLNWPADHIGWQLQAQTNALSAGLGTNWVNYSPSTTTNQVAIPINPANGTVFYRLIYRE